MKDLRLIPRRTGPFLLGWFFALLLPIRHANGFSSELVPVVQTGSFSLQVIGRKNGQWSQLSSSRSSKLPLVSSDPLSRLRSTSSQPSEKSEVPTTTSERLEGFLRLIRPWTLFQAVGAFAVGSLSIKAVPPLAALVSVYLSYGMGMVANDCVDAEADAKHIAKRNRPIPSGLVSLSQAKLFTIILAVMATIAATATQSRNFVAWTLGNMLLMILYAQGGFQRIFLVKNILVGWLGISPLVGAAALTSTLPAVVGTASVGVSLEPLLRLAAIGMAVSVSLEILYDLEDIRVDKLSGKNTVPHAIGAKKAHKLAYTLAISACALGCTSGYRSMFASPPIPLYKMATAVGTAMTLRASVLPARKGQRLLKKSVYVLLAGSIGSLLLAQLL